MTKPRRGAPEAPPNFVVSRPLGQNCLLDLRIRAAGHLPAKTQFVDQPFPIHAVGLVVQGFGTYQVDDGPVREVGPGTLFTVYPGPHFRYGAPKGATWEEYFVIFEGAGVTRLTASGIFPVDGGLYPVEDTAPLVERLREILRVLSRNQPGDADRAALLAERYLLEAFHARTATGRGQNPSPGMQAVLSHCRRHFAEAIDFTRLARHHAMSYSLLRQRMRQLTGAPPAQYLTRLRCEEARRLLSDTDLSVKEIGARVGIADPYTFSRTFKKCVRVAPEHYRRQTAPWHG